MNDEKASAVADLDEPDLEHRANAKPRFQFPSISAVGG